MKAQSFKLDFRAGSACISVNIIKLTPTSWLNSAILVVRSGGEGEREKRHKYPP